MQEEMVMDRHLDALHFHLDLHVRAVDPPLEFDGVHGEIHVGLDEPLDFIALGGLIAHDGLAVLRGRGVARDATGVVRHLLGDELEFAHPLGQGHLGFLRGHESTPPV